jgi:hypothetical protein
MSVPARTRDILRWVQGSDTRLPTRATLAPDHVLDDEAEAKPKPFEPNVHYFQIRVNEMFLEKSRQWFARYDPMVLVVAEFIYDKKVRTVPMVVGRTMLEKFGQKLPSGTILADTRVAGPHPYKGGRLNLLVMLSQIETANYARNLMQVLESAAGLSLATGLGAYLPVAGVVLDGLQTLLGLEPVKPLVAFRKEFDPDAGDAFEPSWFALIDLPEDQLDPEHLWVKKNRLMVGTDPDNVRPFREGDFVLYSIRQQTETTELEILPFYPLWQRVQDAAEKSGKDEGDPNWESARSDMRSLYQTLLSSPDLTERQADELTDTWVVRAQAIRDRGVKIAHMDSADLSPAEQETQRIRARIGSILED